jgi:hypothetical protein
MFRKRIRTCIPTCIVCNRVSECVSEHASEHVSHLPRGVVVEEDVPGRIRLRRPLPRSRQHLRAGWRAVGEPLESRWGAVTESRWRAVGEPSESRVGGFAEQTASTRARESRLHTRSLSPLFPSPPAPSPLPLRHIGQRRARGREPLYRRYRAVRSAHLGAAHRAAQRARRRRPPRGRPPERAAREP